MKARGVDQSDLAVLARVLPDDEVSDVRALIADAGAFGTRAQQPTLLGRRSPSSSQQPAPTLPTPSSSSSSMPTDASSSPKSKAASLAVAAVIIVVGVVVAWQFVSGGQP